MPRTRLYPNAAARQAAYRQRLAGAGSTVKAPCGPSPPSGHTPGYPRWKGLLRQSQACLTVLLTEMETYYEQRSEPWQESERGAAFLQRLENLQEAREAMEELDW